MTLGTEVLRYARISIPAQEGIPPVALLRALVVLCDEIGEEHESLVTSIVVWFNAVRRHLPPAYMIDYDTFTSELQRWNEDDDYDRGEITVPLYDLVPMGHFIQSVHGHFIYDDDLLDRDLATELRQQLRKNEASAHGLSMYHRTKTRVPSPEELDWSPQDYIEKFLHHTPFYHFFHTQVPFRIPRHIYAMHGIVLAPPGHGKTQLLGSLIARFLKDDNAPGLFVLDPHGDLFNTLRQRVDGNRLIVLDPDTNPPPLNFLDFGNSTEAQTLQTFSYLMSSLSGGLSDKQQGLVPFLLALLRKIPDASINTLRLLMDEKVKSADKSRFWPYMQQLDDEEERDFFVNIFYANRMGETKEAIAWRLYAALSNKTFRQMFGAKTNSFNAAAAMRDRKIVLVKGSESTLGEAGAPIFLQFIVAQAMQASFQRAFIPENQRHLCMLIIDEAKHVFNDQTERILTECRKWNLGFLAASQLISQIPENVRAAIYGATAIKISGPVSANDANQLAREMYTTPEFIRSMKAKERSHADWAFYVSGMTDKAVKVRVPYGALEALPARPRRRRAPSSEYLPQTHEAIPTTTSKVGQPIPASQQMEQDRGKTQTHEISDIELVITAARRLETLLETHYGVTGRGLHEKLDSVEKELPPQLLYSGRYIATMRNNVVHVDAFTLPDRERFIRYVQQFESRFSRTHEGSSKRDPSRPSEEADTTTTSQAAEDDRNWLLEDMRRAKAEAEASEATIKPGRDWSEPT